LGQALIDGNFDHVGKIKGPILRGLSARAPYFHNGSARTLLDAVHFYETRFGLTLTSQQESDLVAFLGSLLPTDFLRSKRHRAASDGRPRFNLMEF